MRSKKSLEMFNMKGKTVLVTGGAGHLGERISEAFAEAGANVVVASRNLENCSTIAERIRGVGSGDSLALELDITKTESIKGVFEKIKARFDRIDVLVNNAYCMKGGSLEGLSDEDWSYGLDGTLGGVFRCTREVIPFMKEQGGGVIINIGSMYGIVSPDWRIYKKEGFSGPPSYGVSKAGVIHFTKYCACHLARYGIRVNAVSPGPFLSEAVQNQDWFMEEVAAKNPMGRIGKPEELKGAVIFLASEASTYVTGHNLVVDGGWTAW